MSTRQSMIIRTFEFSDGSLEKFWRITLFGKTETMVIFGRRGTNGHAKLKKWASEAEARKYFEKLIAEKTKKGYVETTPGFKSAAPAKARRGKAKS